MTATIDLADRVTQSPFLRRVLALDAVSTLGTGALLTGGADLLQPWLGLSAGLQQTVGATFLAFGALVGLLASRAVAPRIAIWAVVAYNALFVVECLVALAAGMISPTPLGASFVLALAGVVALLAAAERVGLGRSDPALAAAI